MVPIIGPTKWYGHESSDEIKEQTANLERYVNEADAKAEEFCKRLREITAQTVKEMNSYIESQGLFWLLCATAEEKPFTSYNPSIKFRELELVWTKGVDEHVKSLSKEQDDAINDLLNMHFTRINLASVDTERILRQQRDAYENLIGLTVVDECYSTSSNKDSVIMHVSDMRNDRYLRVKANLDTLAYDILEQQDGVESLSSTYVAERIEQDTAKRDSNVYVVTNFSKKISAEPVIDYVLRRLKLHLNPLPAGHSLPVYDLTKQAFVSPAADAQRDTAQTIMVGGAMAFVLGDGALPDDIVEILAKGRFGDA